MVGETGPLRLDYTAAGGVECRAASEQGVASGEMDRVSFQIEYASDALAAMLDKERSTHYLRIMPRLDPEYASDRRRIIDWCYGLIERRRRKPSMGTIESVREHVPSIPSQQYST